MRLWRLAAAAALIAGAAQAAEGPRVVATTPAQGAKVLPGEVVLSVTYDRPMMQGASFTGMPQEAPEIVGQPNFAADGRTISVIVRLKPRRSYVVWLNSQRYKNFKGEDGVSAEPYRLSFSTTD